MALNFGIYIAGNHGSWIEKCLSIHKCYILTIGIKVGNPYITYDVYLRRKQTCTEGILPEKK